MDFEQFKEAIAALVFVTLVIAALALSLDGFQDSIESDLPTNSSTNETFSYTNATSATLDVNCFSGLSCSSVYNGSGGSLIGSGNYSCSDSNITVYDSDENAEYGWNSTLLVSYTCTIRNYQYNITDEGLEGIGNASDYLSTIGTLIGVSVLVMVVIGAFYIARR